MKQTQNTRVVSGGRRGGGVLAGERKGSGSHSGEWRGSDGHSGEWRGGDGSHLHLGRSGTKIRENTGTVAKQKQLPSASRPA